MNKAELVFKAIDVFGEKPQNAVHYPGIVRVNDIAYSDINREFTVGDLYFKRSLFNDGKKYPVLLYIHGGGFIKGDKNYRVTNSEFFAHHGYFVYNIDYRLPPKAALTDNFCDIISAINSLEQLAKTYNIDISKVVVSGDSSGAYQTAMLACSAFDDDLRKTLSLPEIKIKPAAIALMCGLYDMQQLLSGPRLFGVIPETASMILGYKVKDDLSNIDEYEYINFISPVKLVNKNWCPVFMTWADDDLICSGQGPTMAETLQENGIKTETFEVDGLFNNHCYHLMLGFKLANRCMNKCVHFLNDVLDHFDDAKDEIESDSSEQNN